MKTLDNINLDKPSGNYETVLTPTDQLSAGVKAILEIFEEQGVPKYKVDNIAKLFGSVLKVAGVEQGVVEFASDPQQQLDTLESDIATLDADKATSESVALNTDAIADLALNKQNKLSQIDLDNIAMLNQLPDKLDAKQNKLSAQQIANIDDVPNKLGRTLILDKSAQPVDSFHENDLIKPFVEGKLYCIEYKISNLVLYAISGYEYDTTNTNRRLQWYTTFSDDTTDYFRRFYISRAIASDENHLYSAEVAEVKIQYNGASAISSRTTRLNLGGYYHVSRIWEIG